MQNESSGYDITRHELLTAGESRHVERRTEIGEVRIVQTIFGKAKVRSVRKYHSTRLWSSMAVAGLGVIVVALFLWKGIPQVPVPEVAVPVEAMAPPPVAQPAPAPNLDVPPPALPVARAPDAFVMQQAAPEAIKPEAQPAKSETAKSEPVRKPHEKRIVVPSKPEIPAVAEPHERQSEQKAAVQAPVAAPAVQADNMNAVQSAKKSPAVAPVEPATAAVAQPPAPATSEPKAEQGVAQP